MTNIRKPSRARGEERRRDLLEAVIRVLAREGARGVTLRAVADEAGAAHGSAHYYFATQDDMLVEALRSIIAREVAETDDLVSAASGQSPWPRLAAYLAGRMIKRRDSELARYELFLDAARRPRLRAPLRAWGETYVRLLQRALERSGSRHAEADANALLNLINGLMLQQLAAPQPTFERDILLPAIEAFAAGRRSRG